MSPSPEPKPDEPNSERKENFWVQVARYSEVAMIFPAAVVVGWFVGAALDRWLHITWLYLVGILLGAVAGFAELIRVAIRDSK
ncbi:MAG: AtpZ/AtpI family protein [Candidatus Sulfotelmatobacter sp.]